jgi:SAM-dependent methyltransferase
MISHTIVDTLTFLSGAYQKRIKPKVRGLEAVPGGRFLIQLPRKILDILTKAFGFFFKTSPDIDSLQERLGQLHVAQIGGTTRTFFDQATHMVRFNTHDWRSGDNSRDSSDYVKIEHGISLPWDDDSFDVVASRHALEHISNPVAAIKEWMRILKPGGVVYVSVPDRRKTTEHVRELTPLQHFVEDFENDVAEFDLTHEAEIMQAGVGIQKHDKYEIPFIHYHTFEPGNLAELLRFCGLEVMPLSVGDLHLLRHRPWDLIAMARKPLVQ